MNSKPTVLVAGVTGMLGYKIASAILDKGAMQVKALVRSSGSSDNQKQKQLDELKARGVTLFEGDLLDPSSLPKACEGLEAIVSAVRGGQDEDSEKNIVLTGQLNLIEAAKAAGVKRFIPSDYSVDYFKLAPEDHYYLDFRSQVANALKQSGLGHTFVLNGAFTDVVFSPFLKIFDFQAGTFSYWGDGDIPFDTTTTDDTARYVAEAVVDTEMANRSLKVAGDVLSMKQLRAAIEEMTGKKLVEKQLGSVENLKDWIARTKQNAASHLEYLPEQYLFTMVSGKGKLDKLDNERYPHVKPTSVRQFISQADFFK